MSYPGNCNQRFGDKYPRIAGLIVMAIGAGLIYYELLGPMREAQAGAAHISLSKKAAIFGVVAVIAGLAKFLFGHGATRILRVGSDESKAAAYTGAFILCTIGLLAYLGMKNYLESKGYVFR